MTLETIRAALPVWRRDFHHFPELGFLEYRTAAAICSHLAAIPGWNIRVGSEVMDAGARMSPPSTAECERARRAALASGADSVWIDRFGDGMTGIVADWKFPNPGPTIAFRFDLDALPIQESAADSHRPAREGFASGNPGVMHACGHDAHSAVGMGLAQWVPHLSSNCGTLRLIFQPAEEGCRGAQSLVSRGIFKEVDYLVGGHIGCAARQTGLVVCGCRGFLATTKFDVILEGVAAHAGATPQKGRNALLAAAALAVQLHAIPRHGDGDTRINVGTLHAGSGRNIIADRAVLEVEVRGTTSALNDYMMGEARRIVDSIATMYGVAATVRVMGAAGGATSDAGLKAIVREAAALLPETREVVDSLDAQGSEDMTFMMDAVQARGGQATYLLVGTQLASGHHNPSFDFDESSLWHLAQLYAAIATTLLNPS